MSIGHTHETVRVDVAAGTAFTLLLRLAAASGRPPTGIPDELSAALAEVGDQNGEAWLNLLGVPLDAGAPYDAMRLRQALAELDALELRRHLLGRFAWSWCTIAGAEIIDDAAAGEAAAADRLLALPRYYGGHARDSLSTLLPLDPEATKERIMRAVEAGAKAFIDNRSPKRTDASEHDAADALARHSPLLAIERLTGFRYAPEPEAERVVLVPHTESALPLVLAQHRSSRVIAYHAHEERGQEERLVALGRALADPKRVEVLALVGRGVVRSSDLVRETGLSRSTVHHHLAQLRDAGLLMLEGNARAYTYLPRGAAATDAAALVAAVLGTKEAN